MVKSPWIIKIVMKWEDEQTHIKTPLSWKLICVFLDNCYTFYMFYLKTVDTIGNCQRLAFTVGVSHHMHKITNL